MDYWDTHNVGSEPARWDYGDWVRLSTDAGPFTVTWTNSFHPYGVEVFFDPIELGLGPATLSSGALVKSVHPSTAHCV